MPRTAKAPHEIPPDAQAETALVALCLRRPAGIAHVQRLVQDLEDEAVVGPLAPVWRVIRAVVLAGDEPTTASVAARLPVDEWPFSRLESIVAAAYGNVDDRWSDDDAAKVAASLAEGLLLLQKRRAVAEQLYDAWLSVTAEGLSAAAPFIERASTIQRSVGTIGDVPSLGELAEEAYQAAVEAKAAVVAGDEREDGLRVVLNYGHTLAHALEGAVLGAGSTWDLRHGEAVAIGLVFAAELACRMGRVDRERVERHRAVVHRFGLSADLPSGARAGELVQIMARDKKSDHDLTFVLDGPRGVEVVHGVDPAVVVATLQAMGAAP